MREIDIGQGFVTQVDDDIYDELSKHKWKLMRSRGKYYVQRAVKVDTRWTTELLHNIILSHKGIDHKDRDGLNNQRDNLRKATHQQNCCNRVRKVSKNIWGYRGVSKKLDGKWRGYILNDGHQESKTFQSPHEAAQYYNNLADKYFGEFAILNEIKGE